MALASSMQTNSTAVNSTSSAGYLLPKNDLILADNQLIEILLHGQSNEQKIQTVNRWCKSSRRNRLSTILDVSQRYDVLVSLVNILKQTINGEFQLNCLTLLSELQSNIQNYDQRVYLPAIVQCYSSSSIEVQSLTSQILIKQIFLTSDVRTFLFIFTEEGLKSTNNRLKLQSIQVLTDLLTEKHRYENLSSILEILLINLNESNFHGTSRRVLLRSVDHMKMILGSDLFNNYLESYSSSLRRTYKISQNENANERIPVIDTDLEDEEQTPRATFQVSQIREATERSRYDQKISNKNNFHEEKFSDEFQYFPHRRNETGDFHSIVEIIRSKWFSADETTRLDYLDRFKQASDRCLQSIRSQNSPLIVESQFHQILHQFLSSVLDLLNFTTLSNIELSIRIKLVLSTCLGWLIKHGQISFCKKTYKIICTVFKNILFHGTSNNRQLAKLSVSVILLLENFVEPQLILGELIDEDFPNSPYRIQLEMLAIVTATLLKFRQQKYGNLTTISKNILPMLISTRREIRHGAIECFTVICSYFHDYLPIDNEVLQKNSSIKILFSSIENLSSEAAAALGFRLQRNLLPSLTDEGNITPGLVCDSNTLNDPDGKFIVEGRIQTSNLVKVNTQILQLPISLASNNKNNSNETAIRTRDVAPLKPTEIEIDQQRSSSNNYHQHQTFSLNKTNLPTTKRQTSNATNLLNGPTNKSQRQPKPTEKYFLNEFENKTSSQLNIDDHHNNTLQFRPLIPRRSSAGRFPVVQNFSVTSETHLDHQTKEFIVNKRHFDSDIEHDDGIDSAIESRSLSINTAAAESPLENGQSSTNKSGRSVHSSSTRRKAERLFSTGSDFESASARTLTPENSNESGVYSRLGREIDGENSRAERPLSKDQLFSTRPRLARSGSKSKLDRSQLPPTDPSISARVTTNDQQQNNSTNKNSRTNSNKDFNVEISEKNFFEEKSPSNFSTNENQENSTGRRKLLRSSLSAAPLNMITTQSKTSTADDQPTSDDIREIRRAGKISQQQPKSRIDLENQTTIQPTSSNSKLKNRSESVEMFSDEFDSVSGYFYFRNTMNRTKKNVIPS